MCIICRELGKGQESEIVFDELPAVRVDSVRVGTLMAEVRRHCPSEDEGPLYYSAKIFVRSGCKILELFNLSDTEVAHLGRLCRSIGDCVIEDNAREDEEQSAVENGVCEEEATRRNALKTLRRSNGKCL